MKPGGGSGVSSEPSSLVVQFNPNSAPQNYGSLRGMRSIVSNPMGLGSGSQARHKLPTSPTGPRFLPSRNISALAKPLPKTLSSPKKYHKEGYDYFDDYEHAVEKKPKYNKQLPLSYQIALQDHNYCASLPAPPTNYSTAPVVKLNNNGLTPLQNGSLSRSNHHTPAVTQALLQQALPQSPLIPRGAFSRVNQPLPIPVPNYHGDESDISSDGESSPRLNSFSNPLPPTDDGEETETAPEDEDSITRCICDFQHDDGYMICCDKCLVWQHVDCMEIERDNIPEKYSCEECEPRKVDKERAIRLQVAKRNQFNDSSDSVESPPSKNQAGQKKPNKNNNVRGLKKNEKKGRWKPEKKNKYKPKPRQRRAPVNKKDKKEERSPSPSPNSLGVHQLRQWIDTYEEAVTNHYSQELRARIAAIKVNGVHSDLRIPGNLSSTPKCRVTQLASGSKILCASTAVPGNQAIIEVRGKYMLSKSNLTTLGSSSGQKWSPYLFYHKLGPPGSETTEVCVDTTTYGNDARFVRRSCRPNAEVRHCIEKGALHLYIVSSFHIESKNEITIPVKPGQLCSCGAGDKCTANLPNSLTDKRRRGRRRTLSESSTIANKVVLLSPQQNSPPISPLALPPVIIPVEIKEKEEPEPAPLTPPDEIKNDSPAKENKIRGQTVSSRRATTPATRQEERKRTVSASSPTTPDSQQKKNDSKMTREERKMEAIMKAFERMEKDEARKHHGGSTPIAGPGTTRTRKTSVSISPVREKPEKTPIKKKTARSVRETRSTKGAASLRSRRSTRRTNTRKVQPRGRNGPKTPPGTSDEEDSPKKRRSSPRKGGLEYDDDDDEDDDDLEFSSPEKSNTPDRYGTGSLKMDTTPSDMTSPPQVSNTCLLVAAAVGPLAPGFKFPKSKDPKKNLMSSWFGSGDLNGPSSPPRAGVALAPDFAKKRWLRQAISEDSDSPKQAEAVSPTEMAAPLKKRRFARESVSSELSYTPPATPQASNQLGEDDENSVLSPSDYPEKEAENGPKTPINDENCLKEEDEEDDDDKATREEEKARVKEEARVKRKLSISEYRERLKAGLTGTQIKEENTNGPLDDDEENSQDGENITPLPILEDLFKKGPSGFNAAPTLVEQQREALTDRLRREFGLFLSDDEEEKHKRAAALGVIPELIALDGSPPARFTRSKTHLPPTHQQQPWNYYPPPPPPPLPKTPPPPPPPPPANPVTQ